MSGDAQSGDVGVALANPLTVRITDSFDNPIANVTVNFAVSSGAGTLGTVTTTTSAQGMAATGFTLTAAGGSTVSATSPAVAGASVVFNANTGPTIVGQVALPEGLAYPFLGVQRRGPAGGIAALGAGSGAVAAKTTLQAAPAVQPRTAEEASRRLEARGRIIVSFRPEAFGLPSSAQVYRAAGVRESAVNAYRTALQPLEDAGLYTQRAVSPAIGAVLVQAAPDRDPEEVMALLRQDPRIAAVEEDGIQWALTNGVQPAGLAEFLVRHVPSVFPNRVNGTLPVPFPVLAVPPTESYATDPFSYYQAWHYNQVGANFAWPMTTGGSSVRVAIIDTGINPSQPDIAGNLSTGGDHFDFTDGTTIAYSFPQPICGSAQTFLTIRGTATELAIPRNQAQDPLQLKLVGSSPVCWTRNDAGSHGTHVSGTIGARSNGSGATGLNFNVALVALRALGVTGSGFTFDVTQAILYAGGLPATYTGAPFGFTVQMAPAHIVNMSLGGTTPSVSQSAAITAASANSLFIVSAGNSSTSATGFHPASHPDVFTVAALDPFGGVASYSNNGPPTDGAAPGGDFRYGSEAGVLSSTWNYQTGQPNWAWYHGTSMAAPHVTGVAALVKAANPSFTPSQLRVRLEAGAIDLGPTGRDNETGFGLVNAYNSMTGTRGPVATTTVQAIDATSGAVVKSQMLGSDGRFTMTNLPAGDYYVVARQDANADASFGFPGRRFNWAGGGRMMPISMNGSAMKNVGFTLAPPTEHEPNDNTAQAQPLVVDSWVGGNLSGPDTKDMFSIMIPTAGTYTFETSGFGSCGVGTDLDTVLRLLDTNGGQLALNDDTTYPTASYPGLWCSRISMSLQAGRYFLEVGSSFGSQGTYRLHARTGN